MSVCRYQQKYQQATEHRPDKLTERVTRRCLAAGSKKFWRVGDKFDFSFVSLVWQGFDYLQVYLQNT
ncbi:hypothetical protein X899_4040 [Burkholderia pseudomallei TSV 25]|nr:hypothetical protein X899_4040 [Burkholderia pseudomallei TSV 25]